MLLCGLHYGMYYTRIQRCLNMSPGNMIPRPFLSQSSYMDTVYLKTLYLKTGAIFIKTIMLIVISTNIAIYYNASHYFRTMFCLTLLYITMEYLNSSTKQTDYLLHMIVIVRQKKKRKSNPQIRTCVKHQVFFFFLLRSQNLLYTESVLVIIGLTSVLLRNWGITDTKPKIFCQLATHVAIKSLIY